MQGSFSWQTTHHPALHHEEASAHRLILKGNIQRTFREQAGYIEGTFWAHWGHNPNLLHNDVVLEHDVLVEEGAQAHQEGHAGPEGVRQEGGGIDEVLVREQHQLHAQLKAKPPKPKPNQPKESE